MMRRYGQNEPTTSRFTMSKEPGIKMPGARSDTALERHYSVQELVALWGFSEKTIRRMFNGEPGVVEWGR